MTDTTQAAARVDYRTEPGQYRHWNLAVDGAVARLTLDIAEDGGIRPGYKLKLNSYDRIFCSGANIFMLGVSSHAWKVNFCKFTNETRNGIEDSSKFSGLKFVAAVNGACAGGGYELALACDEIVLVDDRSSAVSLPEVPLLGVLPGTGGLTRVTDKRRVRHDLADIFCTSVEGVRGQRAVDWRLVDQIAKPAQFAAAVSATTARLAEGSTRPAQAQGVALTRVEREDGADSLRYAHVSVDIDRTRRTATLTIKAPTGAQPTDIAGIEAAAAHWWPLAMARQLDDAILNLRTNELDIGTWLLKTEGDAQAVLASDATMLAHADHWLVRETIGALRRTFARLDVSSRSLFALIEPGSAFAGSLAELAFAGDRSYMLALPDDAARAPKLTLNAFNFGLLPMVNDQSRLQRRFYEEAAPLDAARAAAGQALDADAALALGLITAAPDDIDWDDEIRMVIEERAAMSPDSLTGLEANLRFASKENMNTRIFGRLTAWQNWIFNRPNAVGEKGALKVYGTGQKAGFDLNRV
jgi:benzoyl-CoA-dihydrodiol lyase